MHLLTVFAHPFTDKYPAAVMDAFHEPFREGAHSIDVLDLHSEGFDPRFTKADHAHFWGGQSQKGLLKCILGSIKQIGLPLSFRSTGGVCPP
jgi:NAD(P)H dehydrogenase (quinone)